MIDPHQFSERQFELTAEFGKYLFEHPELDEQMPDGAYVCFEIAGETDFNRYSRELAERQCQEEQVPVVVVRIKGLVPPQNSRLIDPVIEAMPVVA